MDSNSIADTNQNPVATQNPGSNRNSNIEPPHPSTARTPGTFQSASTGNPRVNSTGTNQIPSNGTRAPPNVAQNPYASNGASGSSNMGNSHNISNGATQNPTVNSNATGSKDSEPKLQRAEDESSNVFQSAPSRKLSLDSDDRDKLPDKHGIIHLNVGGMHYATTLETLRNDSNSMLYAMFSGLYKVTKDDNGAYFIDRDGKYFRYILNYLRDGAVELSKKDTELKQILREAQYFGLDGLINEIQQMLELVQTDSTKKGQYAVVYLGGYGKSAQIYTKETCGGFSESCLTLNRLAAEGYHIEGVASGANGHYYAVLRTNEDTDNTSFLSAKS